MLEAKRRSAIFLVLAFILAAATGYLVLEKVKGLNAELGGMTSIYIAKGNIPSRKLINSSQLSKMGIPNKFLTESHILSETDLVNKVSLVPLNPGDIITRNMIKPVSNLQNFSTNSRSKFWFIDGCFPSGTVYRSYTITITFNRCFPIFERTKVF